MAVNTLKLPAEDNSLVIEADTNGWARCSLVENISQKRIYLGAGNFFTVAERLLDGFSKPDILDEGSLNEIDGHLAACLLLLSEAHHLLYVARTGTDGLLLCLDAGQSPIIVVGTMRLSPERCAEWRATLSVVLAGR